MFAICVSANNFYKLRCYYILALFSSFRVMVNKWIYSKYKITSNILPSPLEMILKKLRIIYVCLVISRRGIKIISGRETLRNKVFGELGSKVGRKKAKTSNKNEIRWNVYVFFKTWHQMQDKINSLEIMRNSLIAEYGQLCFLTLQTTFILSKLLWKLF